MVNGPSITTVNGLWGEEEGERRAGVMVPIKHALVVNDTFDIELVNNGHKLILDEVFFRV